MTPPPSPPQPIQQPSGGQPRRRSLLGSGTPPASATATSGSVHPYEVNDEYSRNARSSKNPNGLMVMQRRLFCQTRFSLQILANGVVNGTNNHNSKYAVLDFIPDGMGLMYIQGYYSELFLCMSHTGRLYASKTKSEECKFVETLAANLYNTYHSHKHSTMRRRWHVALSRTGKARLGNRSGRRQPYSRFLKLMPTRTQRPSPTRHSGAHAAPTGRKRHRTKGGRNNNGVRQQQQPQQRDKRKRHRFGSGGGNSRKRPLVEPSPFAM